MSSTDSVPRDFDLTDPAVVEVYDELPLWSAIAGQLLFRHLPLAPGLAALDLGCGTGFPAIELAERLGPPSHVHGIDIWQQALERARRKASIRGVENVTFSPCDGAAMPFLGGAFDLIVSNLGINNFANPPAILAECRRVARSGARIALTTNLQGHMSEFYSIFRSVLDIEATGDLDQHVGHRMTVERLHSLLHAAEFSVVRTEKEQSIMRFAGGTAFLRHSFIRFFFLPAWHAIVPTTTRSSLFERLEAALSAHATAGCFEVTIPWAYVEGVVN